jgi:RNA polymerase sigma-70 factor (ECF subfamily)
MRTVTLRRNAARAGTVRVEPLTWDDASIVEALLASEEGSWDYFIERYAGVVVGSVRRVLRGRGLRPSQADVDDLTENVFVMLLEKDGSLLRRYDKRYRMSAYLAVLARTSVHRWLRKRKPGVQLPDEMWGDSIPDADRLSISDQTTQGEVLTAVRDMIETLSERDQRLLRLFYFDGQDYQAIAKTLGVSVNSVGAALSRARSRLAKALQSHEDLTESDWRSV